MFENLKRTNYADLWRSKHANSDIFLFLFLFQFILFKSCLSPSFQHPPWSCPVCTARNCWLWIVKWKLIQLKQKLREICSVTNWKRSINKFNKLCETKSKQKSNLFNFFFHFGFFFGFEIIASNILKFGDRFLNGKLIQSKTETYGKLNPW